jgi:hypothetical protein
MLVGSGLWYGKNISDFVPNAKFFNTPDTPEGFTMMVSEGGTLFAVTLIRNKATGGESLFMLDAYGNMYYDPGDRSQGLYIVRPACQVKKKATVTPWWDRKKCPAAYNRMKDRSKII